MKKSTGFGGSRDNCRVEAGTARRACSLHTVPAGGIRISQAGARVSMILVSWSNRRATACKFSLSAIDSVCVRSSTILQACRLRSAQPEFRPRPCLVPISYLVVRMGAGWANRSA